MLNNSDLLNNPSSSLFSSIPLVSLVQVVYCSIGVLDRSLGQRKDFKGPKKGARDADGLTTRISSAILATVLSYAMSILTLMLLILFGAPFMRLLPESLSVAMHISLLSVQPLVFVYNLDSRIWKDIIAVKLPLNGVYGASVGTWLGAWLGAIPIPLDWDRPWQRWPITIFVGAYLGTAIGTLVGAIYRHYQPNKPHQA
jgi:phosphatidylinositol glycan class F